MARLEDFSVRKLEQDPQRSPTLPGYHYYSPEVFEAENEKIFARSWNLFCHGTEIAGKGDYFCGTIAGESIFLIRGRDGQARGFYNVCQHRAHELLQGRGNVRAAIVCPYHAWSYGFDGSLRAARETGEVPDFNPEDFCLTPVRVEEVFGFCFVNLDPNAKSFADTYVGLEEDLRKHVTWIDEMHVNTAADMGDWGGAVLHANWKVLAENCLECYHCNPTHPAFVDMVDMQSYTVAPQGNWIKSTGQLGKMDNAAYEVDPDAPCQVAMFWFLWPGSAFSIMPGIEALTSFHFFPAEAEQTKTFGTLLTRPDENVDDECLDYRWNVLWPEDETICESVQKGLKSRGYGQGRFVTSKSNPAIGEHGVHHFQKLYAEAMEL